MIYCIIYMPMMSLQAHCTSYLEDTHTAGFQLYIIISISDIELSV